MNPYGSLTLAEMRERVWRRIDAIRNTNVVVETAKETGTTRIDPLVTEPDMNMYLATALTMRFVDITQSDPSIFADEVRIDVLTNQIEYPLPEDAAFMRAAYWKLPHITNILAPPSERELMDEFDADINQFCLLATGEVPSYRRRLGMIVLNQVPQSDNPGGILVEYVKQILPLTDDGQFLEFPLANMLQEVMIADAVIEIVEERMQLDASNLKLSRDLKLDRLVMAARMSKMPKFVQLKTVGYPMARRVF